MDGNGRWARQRGYPRLEGHRRGYQTVKRIVQDATDLGVKYLTLYVFSVENWARPKHEIDGLMRLIEFATHNELRELQQNNVRMRFIGRRSGLPKSLQDEMDRAIEATKANTGLILTLALNYGGRAEITDALQRIAEDVSAGKLTSSDITESTVRSYLYAPDIPDPDLLIRTAGEMRVSNFLLWEVAYSELWVTDAFWPDFSVSHLTEAIRSYQGRVRKFGTIDNE
jgi:undecaprenyl diphosphate synthase